MSRLDKLAELSKALLTTDAELKNLRATLGEVKQEVGKLTDSMQNFRERLVRLETTREADKAQLAAGLARFKAEVERAETKLSRYLPPASESSVSPTSSEEDS